MARKSLNRRAGARHRTSRRTDDGNAFFPDPQGGPVHVPDDLAEHLGEDFVQSAVAGENLGDEEHDEDKDKPEGGPFVISTAREEFAAGTDASNPEDAEPAPFPTALSES